MFFKKTQNKKQETVDLTQFLNKQILFSANYSYGPLLFEATVIAVTADNSAYKVRNIKGESPYANFFTYDGHNAWLSVKKYPIKEVISTDSLTEGTS